MTDWEWVDEALMYQANAGYSSGVRDDNLVKSALARPEQKAAYDDPDLADLAAAYAFGIAKNHGFVDANKRTAWLAARLFVEQNGGALKFSFDDAEQFMVALANGEIIEQQAASWFRERLV